jgi:hypothetical protein
MFSTDSSTPEPHSDRGEASLGRPNGHTVCDAHGVANIFTDGVTDIFTNGVTDVFPHGIADVFAHSVTD